MFRPVLALVLCATLFAPTADAQPLPRQPLPLAPGVMPGSPWGPGMPFAPTTTTPRNGFGFGYSRPNVFAPVVLPWGWGYPYSPFGYGFGAPFIVPQPVVTVEQPVAPSRPEPTIVLANQFPATLTLQFPAAAEVWLDGEKVEGAASDERVLTSPVLRAGQSYAFDVKARWKNNGKTYETTRRVSVGSGDRSRLLIVSGEEVRE